jgi:hypothetical protein
LPVPGRQARKQSPLNTHLKKYPTGAFTKEIWQEIEFIFWRERVSCLRPGMTGDGVDPVSIETTKRGVEISGAIWFLPEGSYALHLCLSRPGFSSIESVSVGKLRRAVITGASLEGRTLKITVMDNPDATDEISLA